MAELFIECPGQPAQTLPVGDETITVGRGEDCTAFLVEKKASRRHLKVRSLPEGGVVAEDQNSSNGSWVTAQGGPEQRFLRRLLADGDVMRIGDTRITYRETAAGGAAPPAQLVSGKLQLLPSVPEADVAMVPDAGDAIPDVPLASAPPEYDDTPLPPDRTGLMRSVAICGLALAVLVGVELYLGEKARRNTRRKEAHLAALRILDHVDAGYKRFKQMRDAYARDHPGSTDLLTLDRYVDELRQREEHSLQVNRRLDDLLARAASAPAAEVHFQLLQLRRELPGDADFALRVSGQIAELERRRAEADLDGVRDLEGEVERLLAAKRCAHAARAIAAFKNTHPGGLGSDAHERWERLRARVDKIVKDTFETVWAEAEAEKDPVRKRELLAAAWPSLAGSKQGDQIGDRLRSAAALAVPRAGSGAGGVPRPGATPPGKAPTPRVPSETELLLTKAREAEEKLLARDWLGGRALLAELLEKVKTGTLRTEWTERRGEVDLILGLVTTLAEAADQEKKPRRKLSIGTWTVVEAKPVEVTLASRKQGTKVFPWKELPAVDVLALLRPARMGTAHRPAVAVLAANLGERQAFVQALIPLYEKGGDLAQTDRLVARHLFGRTKVPAGGYRHYKGEILDQGGYQRRLEQERITYLRKEADRVLALVAKEAVFKKLARLRTMRDELDTRRRYALLAIFNTTHYPYPANKSSQQYQAVQQEIDRRVSRVREIWNDPYRVRIKRAGQLDKHLGAWEKLIAELEAKKIDVSGLQAQIQPYTLYVTDEPITIRSYYRIQKEAGLQAYNRWVMTAYNPARREVARDSEWRQVQITNEYRMLMGYTAAVTPGPAAYEAIDKDNVAKILDAGRITKTELLRAVRIDNRLVTSARLHSEDMSTRGYFAHQSKPNPATGEGPTGPADRMMKQGYQGWGYSENIAMSGNPQQAHNMWCHSSGHHRNILTGWTDLGSGVGGRNFTQNFASGGGAKPKVYPDTSIRERKGGPPTGQRRRRGQ